MRSQSSTAYSISSPPPSRVRACPPLAQRLPQVIFRVRAAREALHYADDLVTHLLVEEQRLEAERVEQDLLAASGAGLLFSRSEEASSEALVPEVLVNPERLDPAGPAPGPTVEPRHDFALLVADEDGQPLAVVEAGLLDIVVVETVLEKADVARCGLDFDLECLHVHARPAAMSSVSDSFITRRHAMTNAVPAARPLSGGESA